MWRSWAPNSFTTLPTHHSGRRWWPCYLFGAMGHVITQSSKKYQTIFILLECTKCLFCFHVVHMVGLFDGFDCVRTSFDGIGSTITKKSLMKLCKIRSSFSSIFGKRKSPIPGVGLDPFQMAELHGYRWGFLTILTNLLPYILALINSTKMGKFMKFCTFPVIYRNFTGVNTPENPWAFGGKPIKLNHSSEVLFFVGTKLGTN